MSLKTQQTFTLITFFTNINSLERTLAEGRKSSNVDIQAMYQSISKCRGLVQQLNRAETDPFYKVITSRLHDVTHSILHIWKSKSDLKNLGFLRYFLSLIFVINSSLFFFVLFIFFIIIIRPICFVHLEFNIAIGGNFNKSNEYSTSKNWTTQRQKDPNDPRFDINIEISAIIVISFNIAFNTSREKTIDSIL